MNAVAWVLLAVTLVCAVANWVAVSVEPERTTLVYVAKPATMVALIGVALALDPFDDAVRAWFVAALVLCLAGDVFLMLPKDMFVAGLASFLLGHLCYVAGLVIAHRSWSATAVGVAVVAVTLGGHRSEDRRRRAQHRPRPRRTGARLHHGDLADGGHRLGLVAGLGDRRRDGLLLVRRDPGVEPLRPAPAPRPPRGDGHLPPRPDRPRGGSAGMKWVAAVVVIGALVGACSDQAKLDMDEAGTQIASSLEATYDLDIGRCAAPTRCPPRRAAASRAPRRSAASR